MVMQRTDYSIPDSVGILMRFKFDNISLLDFDRLQELHDIGYNRTLSMMDTIKTRIHRRVNPDNIHLQRVLYRNTLPALHFQDIYVEGVNPQQQSYIKKEFHNNDSTIFNFETLKRGYFRLLADNMISDIVPHARYNKETGLFDLHLQVKMEDSFYLRFGGHISSSTSNQMYIGLGFQDLNYYSKGVLLDSHLGKNYNNVQLMGRIDLPTRIPSSFRLIGSFSRFNYHGHSKVFSQSSLPSLNTKDERFVKLIVALPFMANNRAEFSLGFGGFTDRYYQTTIIDYEKDHPDRSNYHLFGGSVSFRGSTLNAKQYATRGYEENLIAQVYTGNEFYVNESVLSGNARMSFYNPVGIKHSWLQISYMKEAYYHMSSKFVLGWMGQALYSSRNFSENYTATMMQAGEFSPTAFSKLRYNEAFRANQFVAGGIKPIYTFTDMLHARAELYAFMPIFPIQRNMGNEAYYGKAFSKLRYMGEVSLVYRLPFGAISAYVNHYSSPSGEWNIGLSIGWQLFNYRFIE
jgi:NTE family protein